MYVTGRSLQPILYTPLRIYFLYEPWISCLQNSCLFYYVVARHAIENKPHFQFDGVEVLVNERNKAKLQIEEVSQIIKYESTACNDKSDKKDYSNNYYNLIKLECY